VGHLPSLDGLRGASFLLVFLAHAGLGGWVPGGFGVTVFFFLSGFLITTQLRLEQDATGGLSLRRFYLRRALRILPPFYLVLALAVAATELGWLAGRATLPAVSAIGLHAANYWVIAAGYGGQPAGTGVYWSLAVEEHFYLLFPALLLLLAHALPRRRAQASVLWSVCLVILAWRCVLVYVAHASTDRTYVATDTRADSILYGCALALAAHPALDGPSFLSSTTWKRWLVPAAIALLLVTFVCRDDGFRESFRYTLQGLALYPVFIVALRWPSWGPFAILNTKPAAFLGELSYALYLVHHVVLDALEPLLGRGVLRGVAGLAVSLVIAWAIHRLVEKPCARLRRRLERSRPGTSSVEPVPSPGLVLQGARES
jgi:peptidoglycan/LPS O-acetylase OafA/YrhL